MRLSMWAVNKPKRALLGFVLLIFALGFSAAQFGGEFNDSFDIDKAFVWTTECRRDHDIRAQAVFFRPRTNSSPRSD